MKAKIPAKLTVKREKLEAILFFVLVALSSFSIVCSASADSIVKYWAIIVDGGTKIGLYFRGDAAYTYHVLLDHYLFNDIYLLSNHLAYADNASNKATLNWALRNWLFQRSDSNDVVFIFYSNHGGGYKTKTNELAGGRYDNDTDEGSEHFIDSQWKGVDECIRFTQEDKSYWDDEIKEDLNYLASNGKYDKLIFTVFACFSGGFIDDLSGPNRIIMTSANETHTSKQGSVGRILDEWVARLIDALHGEESDFDPNTGEIVHYEPRRWVDADLNDDGHVSMWEAWKYAWDHDSWRIQGKETPWLDDDGDGYPTYKKLSNETTARDHCAPYDDGNLAKTVYFLKQGSGGCPTLFVWNGTSYIREGTLDIHAHSDIILQHRMMHDLSVFTYKLQLKEMDNFTSHIDHVRLYAVSESGQWRLCPLTYAYHSELGLTTVTVMFNDNKRVDLNPAETLDMCFLHSTGNPAYFVFEISGYNAKQP